MNPTKPLRLVSTDKLIAEINEKLPVKAVAEEICDVELTQAAHQWKGCCPLHGEDTPSFYVNEGRNLFHCFGCKRGGDAITLVREYSNLTFFDALRVMADHADIDIAAYERKPTQEEKERDELRAWAETWMEGLVPATQRVKAETAKTFGAVRPGNKRRAVNTLPAGLKDKTYLLTGEVLFPYRAPSGLLLGWKTRHEDKKMFRTPNGLLSEIPNAWGLQVAREFLEEGKPLIMVEGEWDTMVIHEHGAKNVAAMGGSKWTPEDMTQLTDLKVKEVVFVLDGDEAGRTAAHNIATAFWRSPDINVRVAVCWPGADPEDIVKAMGIEPLLGLVESARGALEFLLWEEWTSKTRTSLSTKLDFVRYIQAEYGEQLIGVQESLVLAEVSQWMGVSEATVLDYVRADKTQLQAPESEKTVIGKALRDQKYFVDVRKRVRIDDLYVLKHARLFEVMEGMLADNLEFDAATIRSRAEDHGVEPAYVDVLLQTGDLNIGWHEEQIVDLSMRRSSRQDADRFREVIADTSVPANQLIGSLTHAVTSKILGRGSGAFRAITEQVDEAMDDLHVRMKNPDSVVGISLGTQFPSMTKNLQGLQPRRLVLVAATSGRGKSTLTLQWCAATAVHQAIPTDFISLEMDPSEILFKLASHLTGIDSMEISAGALNPEQLNKVNQAMVRIRRSPLRIYAPDGITPNEFLLYAREAVMERRTEIFVIDYAQMVGADPEHQKSSRYEQLGEFAYLAKQKICRGLNVSVLAVAQLKRDSANSDEPTPEDMGDSYQLVRASDVILLINETSGGDAHELWIGKNRQGPAGRVIPVHYDKPTQTFSENAAPRKPDYLVV